MASMVPSWSTQVPCLLPARTHASVCCRMRLGTRYCIQHFQPCRTNTASIQSRCGMPCWNSCSLTSHTGVVLHSSLSLTRFTVFFVGAMLTTTHNATFSVVARVFAALALSLWNDRELLGLVLRLASQVVHSGLQPLLPRVEVH
jgi:hypothetical protein